MTSPSLGVGEERIDGQKTPRGEHAVGGGRAARGGDGRGGRGVVEVHVHDGGGHGRGAVGILAGHGAGAGGGAEGVGGAAHGAAVGEVADAGRGAGVEGAELVVRADVLCASRERRKEWRV